MLRGRSADCATLRSAFGRRCAWCGVRARGSRTAACLSARTTSTRHGVAQHRPGMSQHSTGRHLRCAALLSYAEPRSPLEQDPCWGKVKTLVLRVRGCVPWPHATRCAARPNPVAAPHRRIVWDAVASGTSGRLLSTFLIWMPLQVQAALRALGPVAAARRGRRVPLGAHAAARAGAGPPPRGDHGRHLVAAAAAAIRRRQRAQPHRSPRAPRTITACFRRCTRSAAAHASPFPPHPGARRNLPLHTGSMPQATRCRSSTDHPTAPSCAPSSPTSSPASRRAARRARARATLAAPSRRASRVQLTLPTFLMWASRPPEHPPSCGS